MYEFAFWDVPLDQKISLSTLYGPYLAICKTSTPILVPGYLYADSLVSCLHGWGYDPPPQ
jgi:hypothetical protein